MNSFLRPLTVFLFFLHLDKPRVRLLEGTQLTLKEGDSLVLTCNFSCHPDQQNISWHHPSYNVDESINILRDQGTLKIYPVTKTYTGTFTCNVINEVGTGTANIYITVQCKYMILYLIQMRCKLFVI